MDTTTLGAAIAICKKMPDTAAHSAAEAAASAQAASTAAASAVAAASSASEAANVVDDIILVQNTQPVEQHNKIWFVDDEPSDFAQVPTMEDLRYIPPFYMRKAYGSNYPSLSNKTINYRGKYFLVDSKGEVIDTIDNSMFSISIPSAYGEREDFTILWNTNQSGNNKIEINNNSNSNRSGVYPIGYYVSDDDCYLGIKHT